MGCRKEVIVWALIALAVLVAGLVALLKVVAALVMILLLLVLTISPDPVLIEWGIPGWVQAIILGGLIGWVIRPTSAKED